MTDWTNEIVIEFVELYQSEPALWNPKHSCYRDKSRVNDAWKRISKRMNISVQDLKHKKNSMMATFRGHLRRKKASLQAGAGPDDVYKPIWFLYNQLESFLGNFDEYYNIEYEQELNQSNQLTQTNSNQSQIVRQTDADEISLYGELLVTKLRKFDRTTRLIICNKIDNLFFETELKLMTDGKNSYQDPLSHDVPTTSRNGKLPLKRSSSHSSFSQSELSENPQFE